LGGARGAMVSGALCITGSGKAARATRLIAAAANAPPAMPAHWKKWRRVLIEKILSCRMLQAGAYRWWGAIGRAGGGLPRVLFSI